jgi:WD40 repeat protein
MRSRSYALSAVLATAALAATGLRERITPAAVPAAVKSTTTTNQEVGARQFAESAGAAERGPNRLAGDAPAGPENWEIAATLAGHNDDLTSLAFSPDGKRLFSSSRDGVIKVWDLRARKELASIIAQKDGKRISALAVSPSGDVLVSGAGTIPGDVKVWDARTLQLRATFSYRRQVSCLAFSHRSDLIAAAGENDVYIWRVAESRLERRLPVGMWPITGLAFSPDDRILYVGGLPAIDKFAARSGVLRAWDWSNGSQLGEIEFSHPVESVALSEDGNTLAVAAVALHALDVVSENDRVRFKERFSALDTQVRSHVPFFQEQFRRVALSPSQKTVAGAAGSPGPLAAEADHVALFALNDGRRLAQLSTPRPTNGQVGVGHYDINAVAFSPDGKLLASGGKERMITLWMAVPVK